MGMRYRGYLNEEMKMHGEGVLLYRDDCRFEGTFDSLNQTATGYLRDKDGELIQICKDKDFSLFYR